jgi:hypothetical protein
VVGKGGFGKVYAAMRIEDEKDVLAMKKISKRRQVCAPCVATRIDRVCRVLESRGLTETVWVERDVMSRVTSPFCVNLVHAFQVRHA